MHDVTIVGGGPGGLCAAAHLARLGHDVALLEEHSSFGDPVHCTGVLAADAFDELNLSRGAILNALPTARFHSPSGLDISYTPPQPEAVVIDRLAFDAILSSAAERAGATLMRGSRVMSARVDATHVTLEVAGGATVRSRALILACGASYGLQRRLGLGIPSVYLSSAQLELPATRAGTVDVYLGALTAPRGFAWAVPVTRETGQYVRLGVMCGGLAGEHFQQFLAR